MSEDNELTGRRLRQLRVARGLRQEDVATHLGVSAMAVSHWESGRNGPDRDNVYQLDALLGARGEVVEMFGFAPDSADLPPVTQLAAQVRELAAAVSVLAERLDALERHHPRS